ncbi:MAG: methylamine utilization protein [Kordiimonas sp.]
MISLKTLLFWFLILALGGTSPIFAGNLTVSVKDSKTEPIDRAVVTLLPLFGEPMPMVQTENAIMKQQNTMFQPFILPVRTGSSVSFPNLDEFRHHVYSFSKAKRLELRLYGKDESNEILFDQAGVVALGCNIHDNMLAYIYVTDDPYYMVADSEGVVAFDGLPDGLYKVSVWHPDQKSKREVFSREIEVADNSNSLNVVLEMRSVRRRQKGADGKEYD